MMAEAPPSGAGSAPSQGGIESDAVLGRRAQLLATEHWGLLAARSTAQSEVLTRITIFLTLVSAGLVTIGLLGQATDFDGWFAGAALAILAFVSVVGAMTQARVFNVAEEDMMYVVAMNRMRGGYADLDPTVDRYFLASIADDEEGLAKTYSFLRPRSVSHLFGSSAVLIAFVEACVVGMLAGSALAAASAALGVAIAVGVAVGILILVGSVAYGAWTYRYVWRTYRPRRRSAPPASIPTAHRSRRA